MLYLLTIDVNRHQRFGVEFVLSIHNKTKIHMFGGMVLRTVGQTEKIDLH